MKTAALMVDINDYTTSLRESITKNLEYEKRFAASEALIRQYQNQIAENKISEDTRSLEKKNGFEDLNFKVSKINEELETKAVCRICIEPDMNNKRQRVDDLEKELKILQKEKIAEEKLRKQFEKDLEEEQRKNNFLNRQLENVKIDGQSNFTQTDSKPLSSSRSGVSSVEPDYMPLTEDVKNFSVPALNLREIEIQIPRRLDVNHKSSNLAEERKLIKEALESEGLVILNYIKSHLDKEDNPKTSRISGPYFIKKLGVLFEILRLIILNKHKQLGFKIRGGSIKIERILGKIIQHGWTVLHFAAYMNSLQCLLVLLESLQSLPSNQKSTISEILSLPTRTGWTVFHIAATKNLEFNDVLGNFSVKFCHLKDIRGNSVLHLLMVDTLRRLANLEEIESTKYFRDTNLSGLFTENLDQVPRRSCLSSSRNHITTAFHRAMLFRVDYKMKEFSSYNNYIIIKEIFKPKYEWGVDLETKEDILKHFTNRTSCVCESQDLPTRNIMSLEIKKAVKRLQISPERNFWSSIKDYLGIREGYIDEIGYSKQTPDRKYFWTAVVFEHSIEKTEETIMTKVFISSEEAKEFDFYETAELNFDPLADLDDKNYFKKRSWMDIEYVADFVALKNLILLRYKNESDTLLQFSCDESTKEFRKLVKCKNSMAYNTTIQDASCLLYQKDIEVPTFILVPIGEGSFMIDDYNYNCEVLDPLTNFVVRTKLWDLDLIVTERSDGWLVFLDRLNSMGDDGMWVSLKGTQFEDLKKIAGQIFQNKTQAEVLNLINFGKEDPFFGCF
eukprot:GHVP01066901.1.p1 GENE.GHVP01066901.1~~GHVP01066901.1.p1  ORF type:complete len:788 (-),score=169.47 GHVP01066901.1:704-3067(-)